MKNVLGLGCVEDLAETDGVDGVSSREAICNLNDNLMGQSHDFMLL